MDSIEKDRVCVCDCNNGRFITSLTYKEIEYIYDVIVQHAIENGDYVRRVYDAQGAVEKITDMRDYVNKPDRNNQ